MKFKLKLCIEKGKASGLSRLEAVGMKKLSAANCNWGNAV